MTRDSGALKWLLLASVILGVLATVTDPTLYGMNPVSGAVVMNWIKLISLIVTAVSGWLQTSPLKGENDGDTVKRNNITGWLLPLLLAGSLVAAPACGLSLTKPPVVTPQDQEQLRDAATTALAGIEIAGIVMRDGQALVSDLHTAGTPGITLAVRTAVNDAVIRANKVIQAVITRIEGVVKKTDQLTGMTTMKEWMREGIAAFLDVARELEKQADARVTVVGRFIRTALTTVAAFAGVEVSL